MVEGQQIAMMHAQTSWGSDIWIKDSIVSHACSSSIKNGSRRRLPLHQEGAVGRNSISSSKLITIESQLLSLDLLKLSPP